MEPRAKQGIDILFPASVKYSLNLMTDEHTESTAKIHPKQLLKEGYLTVVTLNWRLYGVLVSAVGKFDISFYCKRSFDDYHFTEEKALIYKQK